LEVSENRSNYFDIKEFVEENSGGLVESFMYSLFAGKPLADGDVFDEEPRRELVRRLKKCVARVCLRFAPTNWNIATI
jgi:hypothetical protein